MTYTANTIFAQNSTFELSEWRKTVFVAIYGMEYRAIQRH
jgi:hypothetical protein